MTEQKKILKDVEGLLKKIYKRGYMAGYQSARRKYLSITKEGEE